MADVCQTMDEKIEPALTKNNEVMNHNFAA